MMCPDTSVPGPFSEQGCLFPSSLESKEEEKLMKPLKLQQAKFGDEGREQEKKRKALKGKRRMKKGASKEKKKNETGTNLFKWTTLLQGEKQGTLEGDD